MSAPTICQACGGKIEKPDAEKYVCEHCAFVLHAVDCTVDELIEWYKIEPPIKAP